MFVTAAKCYYLCLFQAKAYNPATMRWLKTILQLSVIAVSASLLENRCQLQS